MNKIAVIGSNSFSGSNFVSHLIENSSYSIIGISRSEEYNPIFLPYKKNDSKRFSFFQLDINKNLETIIDILKKEDVKYVVNFAAQGMVGQSWQSPEQWFHTNTCGIVKLTNSLQKHFPGLLKYVQISTPEIYGSCNDMKENTFYNPSTPYAASKAAGDMFIQTLIQNYGFPANIIRSTNVYGTGQQLFRIIPRSIIYSKMGKKIPLEGGGKAIKSYIHIRDVCEGIKLAMEEEKSGEIYHFSSEEGISIKTLVTKICERVNKDFNQVVEIVPDRVGQDSNYILNSDKARERFNWKPKISIDIGLDEVVGWINNNWDVIHKLPLEYIHKE